MKRGSMNGNSDTPTRIVGGRSPRSAVQRRLGWISTAALIALTAWLVYLGRTEALLFVVAVLINLVVQFRPGTTVDGTGIRGPWPRRTLVSWADVDHVVAPQPGVRSVQVRLHNGEVLVLGDVDADESAAVARIGGVILV